LTHEDLHERVIQQGLLRATRTVWIATADLFDTFWIGEHCKDCTKKRWCPDPIGD
jgi:hypothetical protein